MWEAIHRGLQILAGWPKFVPNKDSAPLSQYPSEAQYKWSVEPPTPFFVHLQTKEMSHGAFSRCAGLKVYMSLEKAEGSE